MSKKMPTKRSVAKANHSEKMMHKMPKSGKMMSNKKMKRMM